MLVVVVCCYCWWKPLTATIGIMVWCEKQQRALFVFIHDKELPVTTNVLYQVFSLYGDVEKIARFPTMVDFHARVNFY